jgi:hypothetical protein
MNWSDNVEFIVQNNKFLEEILGSKTSIAPQGIVGYGIKPTKNK